MAASLTVPASARGMRIGRDAGGFARVFRLVSGALLVVSGIASVGGGWSLWAQMGGFVLALVVFYAVMHRVLGSPALARLDPFVATVLVLAPLDERFQGVGPARHARR